MIIILQFQIHQLLNVVVIVICVNVLQMDNVFAILLALIKLGLVYMILQTMELCMMDKIVSRSLSTKADLLKSHYEYRYEHDRVSNPRMLGSECECEVNGKWISTYNL